MPSNIYMTDDHLAYLCRHANDIGITTNELINRIVAHWIDLEERKLNATLEALADVEAGKFVAHEEVRRWIESLDTDNPLPMPQSKR